MRRELRVFICVSAAFIVFLLSASLGIHLRSFVWCYEPSSNKATAFNINGHYREIDDAQARKIENGLIDKLVNEGLTNPDFSYISYRSYAEEKFQEETVTVTGYVGQVLDECDIDDHAHELLHELYNIAYKELTGEEEEIE